MTSINSAFAAPSTGAARRRTSSSSPRMPARPDLAARGMTRTLMTIPPAEGSITDSAPARQRSHDLPVEADEPMQLALQEALLIAVGPEPFRAILEVGR
jgi:hypothetical protein